VEIKKRCSMTFFGCANPDFGETRDHEVRGTSARELIRS